MKKKEKREKKGKVSSTGSKQGFSTDHQLLLSWSARRSATPPAQSHETGRNHQRTFCVYLLFSPYLSQHTLSLSNLFSSTCPSILTHTHFLFYFYFFLSLTADSPPTHSSSPHAHSPDCSLAVPAPTSPSVPPNPS